MDEINPDRYIPPPMRLLINGDAFRCPECNGEFWNCESVTVPKGPCGEYSQTFRCNHCSPREESKVTVI